MGTALAWVAPLLLIGVALPSAAQAPVFQSGSAETDYFNAIAKAEPGRARDLAIEMIEDIRARASPDGILLRTWRNRQAAAQLLLPDLDGANRAYAAACQYPVTSDPPLVEVECLAGLALTEMLSQGVTDISSQRAETAAAISVRQNIHGFPFILAHMAFSVELLDKSKAAEAEAELDRANQELAPIGVNTNPRLTELIAAMYNKIGQTYSVGHQPDDVNRVTNRTMDLHASVVDHNSPDLFMTLFNAVRFSRDPETVRRFVLWMFDIIEVEPDPKEAQTEFDLLTYVVSAVFLKDTYTEMLWRWQDHLEKIFGNQTTEAGKNLIAISDLMFQLGRDEEGNALRDRGLAILAKTMGADSDTYRQAADSIQYRHYLSLQNINVDLKKTFGKINKEIEQLKTSPYQDQQLTFKAEVAEKIRTEVDKAISVARSTGDTGGLQILLTKWGKILVEDISQIVLDISLAEYEFRESEGVRLMEAAWSLALQAKAFNHFTFPQIVSRIAKTRKAVEGLSEALVFLDEAVSMIDKTVNGYIEADARLLSVYADLLSQSRDVKDGQFAARTRSTIQQKFAALDALTPTDIADGKAMVQAMIAFGEAFQKRGENALAVDAYQRTAELAKNEDLADDIDRDRIDVALARLSGTDPADIEFMRISKLQDDDLDKPRRFSDAAGEYHDITINRPQALRFIREAVRLERQQILKIVESMPLSGSQELEDRKGFLDSDLILNLDLLLADGTGLSTNDRAKLQEAVELLQWRRNFLAGNSLLRSAARATLPDDNKKGEAREIEAAIVRWKRIERRLVVSVAGGQSGTLSELTKEQTNLMAQARHGIATLGDEAAVFRGLSGVGRLTLEQIQEAISPHEALIVFAKGDVRGLYALVLTHDRGTLVDLQRGPDGKLDHNRLENLKLAFEAFQASFGSPKQEFNYAAAFSLYEILFAPLELYLTDAKRLTILPDISFPSVAYPALVSAVPAPGTAVTRVSWLTERFATSLALSLDSFVTIRRQPALAGGTKFIGFADPVIQNEACPPVSAFGRAAREQSRGGLCELPQTRDHVTFLARGLGADPNDSILAGPALTRRAVLERLSHSAKVMAFATHGLVSEDMQKLADVTEPALLLSAPKGDDPQADRWLTMSDIELLTINADLVVLSACKTSADSGAGGQAFSGLARAFFEAGARSLIVTNWYIDVVAT
jgi:CHAT domain-containing protein